VINQITSEVTVPTFYVAQSVRRDFEAILEKLDRARKDDTRLKLIVQADNFLRVHGYGWDAVKLRPDKHYKPVLPPPRQVHGLTPDAPRVNGAAPTPAPTPTPTAKPTPLIQVSQAAVDKETQRFTMSKEGRNNLRAALRLHPNYPMYPLAQVKTVESWNKAQMVQAALEFGIDLQRMFETTMVVIPVQPGAQLDIEDAIAAAKAKIPVKVVERVIDTNEDSIEYKRYAVELSERANLDEVERTYFRFLGKLNRTLDASEFDRIAEVYTRP
jgi:hypothetical protein